MCERHPFPTSGTTPPKQHCVALKALVLMSLCSVTDGASPRVLFGISVMVSWMEHYNLMGMIDDVSWKSHSDFLKFLKFLGLNLRIVHRVKTFSIPNGTAMDGDGDDAYDIDGSVLEGVCFCWEIFVSPVYFSSKYEMSMFLPYRAVKFYGFPWPSVP